MNDDCDTDEISLEEWLKLLLLAKLLTALTREQTARITALERENLELRSQLAARSPARQPPVSH